MRVVGTIAVIALGCSSADAPPATTPACPDGVASECPAGCERLGIQQFDGTRGCLAKATLALCAPPPPRARCLGQTSCRRDADGKLYLVPSACGGLAGFDFCGGAEDTRVLSATACPTP